MCGRCNNPNDTQLNSLKEGEIILIQMMKKEFVVHNIIFDNMFLLIFWYPRSLFLRSPLWLTMFVYRFAMPDPILNPYLRISG